jgi:lysophospholipase L1-like esterase
LSLGLIFAFVLLELGVILTVGEQVKFPRRVVGSDFGLRINEPNTHYRHKSADVTVWFRINSRGLRADREYPYEKPAETKRIVSLGDSFTAGYEVDVEQTFSSVLERNLRSRGHDVEVINAGVSGYSTAEACLYLERELLEYDPDLVLISFFGNDLVDNVRANLFRLVDGNLLGHKSSYVPGGRLGDLLNTNPILNFLSERSNAFALAKERITYALKRQVVRENLVHGQATSVHDGAEEEIASQQRKLAAAIYERIYRTTSSRGIPLVIQSIPTRTRGNPDSLTEVFPLGEFDVNRPGIHFFSAKTALEPWSATKQLYYNRSHGHWTPHSHEVSGQELARIIDEGSLLPR